MKISLGLVICLHLTSCAFFFQKIENREAKSEDVSSPIPRFKKVPLDFHHKFSGNGYEFFGSALIDVDNDGVEEVFIAGGEGQDGLYRFSKGKFDLINKHDFKSSFPSYAVLSLDLDNDGYTDLIVSREDGIFYFKNNGRGNFSNKKLAISLGENETAIGLTAADLNNDGLADFYVSTFIGYKDFTAATFNDPRHGKLNRLFLSDDELNYKDATKDSGLIINQNTFASSFVDLDNDGKLDLVAALNTGPITIFKGLGKGKFKKSSTPTGYGFWMGLAICDYNNDGLQDIFVTNAGNTVPKNLLRGDLKDHQVLDTQWRLLENQSHLKFKDVSKEKGILDYEFAWGNSCADFNHDGLNDFVISENYTGWPAHFWSKAPGRLLIQTKDKFIPVTEIAGVTNYKFGQVPLYSDFNNDGALDLIHLNILGEASAFINEESPKKYLKVILPNNIEAVGLKVEIHFKNGRRQFHQVTNGLGYMSDLSNHYIIGYEDHESIKKVVVRRLSGKMETFKISNKVEILQL